MPRVSTHLVGDLMKAFLSNHPSSGGLAMACKDLIFRAVICTHIYISLDDIYIYLNTGT